MNDNEIKERALRGALQAIERGLKVIPISENAVDSNGRWRKKPRVPEWPSRATNDPNIVRKWAAGDYGDQKGRLSTQYNDESPCRCFAATLEGIIVFDVDAPEAKTALEGIFRQAGVEIPTTFTTKSGSRGGHYFFKCPDGYPLGQSTGVLAPHLDTKGGANNQVVLPGTRNPVTEQFYEVIQDAPIAVLPTEVAELIAPKIHRAKSSTDVRTTTVDRRQGSIPDTPKKIAAYTKYLLEKEGGIQGSGGDADLLEVGIIGADFGLSPEKATELAAAIYNPKCIPSWEADELAVKIKNGYRYRESEIGSADPDLALDAFTDTERHDATDADHALLNFESMAKFRATPPEPRHALIKDFMARGNYLTLIYGRGGSGKSLLVQQMTRELSRGRKFLGLEPGDAATKMIPAILSCEEPEEDVHFRFAKQSERIDPTGAGKEPLFCNLRGKDAYLFRKERNQILRTELFNALVRIIKAHGITDLIIDSLSRVFPGNEIDRVDVTSFGKAMDILCMETDCHVIVLAHTNKEGSFSGSSAWEAICRQMFIIESKSVGDEIVYTMTVEKTNEGRRGASVSYRFNDWYFEPLDEEELEALREAKESEEKAEKEKARESAKSKALADAASILSNNEGEMLWRELIEELREYGYKRDVAESAVKLGKDFGQFDIQKGKRTATGNYPLVVTLNTELQNE